ncbi:hypothetical protein [Janthinobacterium sp. 17J80-10]|uniref:hypothetical protein n=1 Tax=Janthinobacterium sp. 17J80-10 TaxID=2497863 RepID=UPI0010056B8C|nr:hypothetical protein [Janthinobacterium sp. 17J80-10]QAU35245.1 hypothetical protein EKL02_14245 [Janthinobacterium sp. 17J80-10]
MWIAILAAGLLSLIVANSFYTDFMVREIPWNANERVKDAGNFHAFATAAELFMRDHGGDPAYLPTGAKLADGTSIVRWTGYSMGSVNVKGLSEAKGLPAGLAQAAIDPTWRIRTTGSGYVLCTGMTAGGVVRMANLPDSPLWNPAITWQQANLTVNNGTNAVEMVTFDVDAASAALCKCDPTMSSGATQCL